MPDSHAMSMMVSWVRKDQAKHSGAASRQNSTAIADFRFIPASIPLGSGAEDVTRSLLVAQRLGRQNTRRRAGRVQRRQQRDPQRQGRNDHAV